MPDISHFSDNFRKENVEKPSRIRIFDIRLWKLGMKSNFFYDTNTEIIVDLCLRM